MQQVVSNFYNSILPAMMNSTYHKSATQESDFKKDIPITKVLNRKIQEVSAADISCICLGRPMQLRFSEDGFYFWKCSISVRQPTYNIL